SNNHPVGDWIKSIKDGVQDLTTLDVLTLTGTLTLTAGTGGKGTQLDPSQLFESLQAQTVDSSKLEVVALTHKEVDLDATTFIAKDADKDLLKIHSDMVQASEEGRMAFLKALGDLLK